MNSLLRLLCVGSLKFPWAKEACETYLLRLGPAFGIREIPASKLRDATKQKEDESARLLLEIEKERGTVYVLDEKGKNMTSQQFSSLLSAARDQGERLTFVLGGAYGLSDAVKTAGRTIRLSDMTLPHELARILFLEQVYRAHEIQKGSGYHH